MEIELSRDVSENIELASKKLGLTKKELVARALKLYLSNVKEYIVMKEEMSAWEKAGREDLAKWEEEHLKDE